MDVFSICFPVDSFAFSSTAIKVQAHLIVGAFLFLIPTSLRLPDAVAAKADVCVQKTQDRHR